MGYGMISWFKDQKPGVRYGLLALLFIVLFGGGYLALHSKNSSKTASNTADPQVAGVQATASDSPSPSSSVTSSPSPSPSASTSATPTPAGATNTPTPTLPPAAYADNFSGHWYINFGDMTLTQSGTQVTGTYNNSPLNTHGSITGTVSSQTLTGTWSLSGGSSGSIQLVKGTHTLSGSYNNAFKWCGALAGYQFPADCGYAGHWVTKIPSNSNCAMDLTRINTSVTGTYCNGSLAGTVSYPANETKLSGTWKISPTTNGSYSFFLSSLSASPHQLWFQGSYSSSEWCGGTTSVTQPTAANCFKN